jgi:hypothetical protein
MMRHFVVHKVRDANSDEIENNEVDEGRQRPRPKRALNSDQRDNELGRRHQRKGQEGRHQQSYQRNQKPNRALEVAKGSRQSEKQECENPDEHMLNDNPRGWKST